MQESQPHHGAPEGAVCADHPERPAAFTCPRCGNYACLFCWHRSSERCDSCMRRDPAAAAPPLPWETQQGNLLQRYFGTLGSAVRPVQTAPAFARRELRPALSFFALTAVPLAPLAGVIPLTQTLEFGSSLSVVLKGNPTPLAIALDVLIAMALQLLLYGVEFAALALPYVSLVRAYTPPERRNAALRVLLYRSWLVPAAMLTIYLAVWILPGATPQTPNEFAALLPLLQLTAMVLLLSAMRATARQACGVGTLLSFVVVAVSFIVTAFVQTFMEWCVAWLLKVTAV